MTSSRTEWTRRYEGILLRIQIGQWGNVCSLKFITHYETYVSDKYTYCILTFNVHDTIIIIFIRVYFYCNFYDLSTMKIQHIRVYIFCLLCHLYIILDFFFYEWREMIWQYGSRAPHHPLNRTHDCSANLSKARR